MRIDVKVTASYKLEKSTFITLIVEPAAKAPDHRVIEQDLQLSATSYNVLGTDSAGNLQRTIVAPPGTFRYDFKATFEAEPNITVPLDAEGHAFQDLPPETLVYLLPSRYVQSDRFGHWAETEFGANPQGGRQVHAVYEWVKTHIKYETGSTDATTTAMDTAVVRLGVCRDFAHMVCALCRALGIPARFVSGYALGLEPFDFHAFAQVYVGGRWYNVDATYNGIREALIPIAVGRDSADVAMTTFTSASKLIEQKVEIHKQGS